MFGLGLTEILVIGAIGMMLFGVKKMPDIGSSLGKAISNFRSAADGKDTAEHNAKPEPDAKKEA